MLKVFACEYGISSDVVGSLMYQMGVNMGEYTWVDCDSGSSWCVPNRYQHLALYVDGWAQHTGMSYEDCAKIDEFVVGRDVLDTDGDGDIEVYLVQY